MTNKPQAYVQVTGFEPDAETGIRGNVGISQTSPGYSNAVQDVPAITLNHGSQTATAGTRVQLHTNTSCREVLITAKPANTGYVYIGGLTVSSSSYGKRLTASESLTIAVNNLSKVWMDVSVNSEGVDYLYVV